MVPGNLCLITGYLVGGPENLTNLSPWLPKFVPCYLEVVPSYPGAVPGYLGRVLWYLGTWYLGTKVLSLVQIQSLGTKVL